MVGRFSPFDGSRCVKLSTDDHAPDDALHISVESKNESPVSFVGDGTKVILIGSELPLNQLANFGFPCVLIPSESFVGLVSISNSAASLGETLSGDMDRSRGFKNGRKVEDLDGDTDVFRVNKGGRSMFVRALVCVLVPGEVTGGGIDILDSTTFSERLARFGAMGPTAE